MLKALITWQQRRKTERQLSLLTDRELADIGIERADIRMIARFDPTAEKRRDVARRSGARGSLVLSGAPTRA